jgi:hypothetical protein
MRNDVVEYIDSLIEVSKYRQLTWEDFDKLIEMLRY